MANLGAMTAEELKSTGILALIFASRMLGLFMVLPVLALYIDRIPHATPFLIGAAAGIYGLTNALLQLPFGALSDYFGRKPIILAGIGIFILGSLIAGMAKSMEGLIIGRALQGAGAVGSPILAFLTDFTREQVRTRAMAVIGVSIGATFLLAMVLGPILDNIMGLSGIFILTALLAALSMILLLVLKPEQTKKDRSAVPKKSFFLVYTNSDLWRVNIAIFIIHAILIALFLELPLKIQDLLHAPLWYFYGVVLVIAALLGLPFLRQCDNAQWLGTILKGALWTLIFAVSFILCATQLSTLMVFSILFFMAFNVLEATLPALVSKLAPTASKGAALGVYSCSQFLGMFTGGIVGGCLQQWQGARGIGLFCFILFVIGFVSMKKLQIERSGQWQEA